MALIDTTGTSFHHVLRGAIALPMGGGSPRLYLLSCMVRSDWHAWQTANNTNPNLPTQDNYSSVITCSTLRASVSTDFGETFLTGVDVGFELQDGTALSDGRQAFLNVTISLVGGTSSYKFSGPPTHIVPQTLIVTPQGRVYVRAYTYMVDPGYDDGRAALFGGSGSGPSWFGGIVDPLLAAYGAGVDGSGSFPANETYAARICDNAFLRAAVNPSTGLPAGPAFRNAATINQSMGIGNDGFAEIDAVFGPVACADATFQAGIAFGLFRGPNPSTAAPSMAYPVFQSCAAHPATKGRGAKVRGPGKLYMYAWDSSGHGYYYGSSDGGDTWAAESNINEPYTSQAWTANVLGASNTIYSMPRDMFLPADWGWFDNGCYISNLDIAVNSPKVWQAPTNQVYAIVPANAPPQTDWGWNSFPGSRWTNFRLAGIHPATADGFAAVNDPPAGSLPTWLEQTRPGLHYSADGAAGFRFMYLQSGQFSAPANGYYYVPPGGLSGAPVSSVAGMFKVGLPSDLDALACTSVAINDVGYSLNVSDFAVAYTWNGNVVMVFGVDGAIRVLKSVNAGVTMTETVKSYDCMQSWN